LGFIAFYFLATLQENNCLSLGNYYYSIAWCKQILLEHRRTSYFDLQKSSAFIYWNTLVAQLIKQAYLRDTLLSLTGSC